MPGRTVVAAIPRKKRLRVLERRDRRVDLTPLDEPARRGHRRTVFIEPGERRREALAEIRVEFPVECRNVGLESALENLVRRLSGLVGLQHALDCRLAVVTRDQVAHQRRLVIREHHLLGIGGVHEAIVHAAHRHELPFSIGVEEARRDVEAPPRTRPMLLVHR